MKELILLRSFPILTEPKRLILSLLFFLLIWSAIFAGTCVSGAQSGTWSVGGSPYIVTGAGVSVSDGEVLIIQPGVLVLFNRNDLTVHGTLIAEGVRFSGAKDIVVQPNGACSALENRTPGSWSGIRFMSADPGSVLENCKILYAGAGISGTAISITDDNDENKNVSVSNCLLAYGEGAGVLSRNTSLPTFTATTIRDFPSHGILHHIRSFPRLIDCTFLNNGDYPIRTYQGAPVHFTNLFILGNNPDAIWIQNSTTAATGTGLWENHGVPYQAFSESIFVAEEDTLRLEPGVEIQMGQGMNIQVRGSLIANGDSCRNIIFTAIDTDKPWRSLLLNESEEGTILNFCNISYGGEGLTGLLELNKVPSNTTVANCKITNSFSSGIWISHEVKTSPLLEKNELRNNAGEGVRLMGSGHAVLRRNRIIANGEEGVNINSVNASADLGLLSEPGHNAIFNNSGWELYNNSPNEIYAVGNYWANTDSLEIDASHIYDKDEDMIKGDVFFLPVDTLDQANLPSPNCPASSCDDLRVMITTPTPEPEYTTNIRYINLSGLASDDGAVSYMNWFNSTTNEGGDIRIESPPNNFVWSAPHIRLVPGPNNILVEALNDLECISVDEITIAYLDNGNLCWEEDSFDNLNTGLCLDAQNDWFIVPGRNCVDLIPDPTDPTNIVMELDAPDSNPSIMGKFVPEQDTGRHRIELRVYIEPGDTTMAKLEVRTTRSANWDKKFQLYFGSHMRLNYGPTQADAAIFLAAVETRRWYHVLTELNLATDLVDVYLDGIKTLENIKVSSGPITDVSVSGWDLPGFVYFDDIFGCRLTDTLTSSIHEPDIQNRAQDIIAAFPNPFYEKTGVRYQLNAAYEKAHLRIYNSIGQQLETKVLEKMAASLEIGGLLPAGLFFLILEVDGKTTKVLKVIKTIN